MGTRLRNAMSVFMLDLALGSTQTRFSQTAYTWNNESSVFIGTKSGTGSLSWNAGTISMFGTIRHGPIALGS